jgi:hypothetical protein
MGEKAEKIKTEDTIREKEEGGCAKTNFRTELPVCFSIHFMDLLGTGI